MAETLQTIVDHQDCEHEHPRWSQNAIEDYMGLKDDIDQLNSKIENGDFSPQFGSGSPEGVVTANISLKYIDTLVPTEYYNETLGSDTGWVAL